MTAGHFGLAAIVRSSETRIPLWALMLATYLMDIVFVFLAAAGIESFAPMNPDHPAYGQAIIHAYYTHSIVGALVLASVAGLLAAWPWGKRGAIVIGGVVLSHWILDLIVHRPDLPVLPGNAGNLPLLGLGLWRFPLASGTVELGLVIAGTYLYYKTASRAAAGNNGAGHKRAVVASAVLGILLLSLLVVDFFSLAVSAAMLLMFLLIVLSGWLDSRLDWSGTQTRPEAQTAAQ